jgi:hypothetical protein
MARSRYTPLINRSIFGMTYEANPLNDVWTGDSTWQYGLSVKLTPTTVVSGTAARTAHQSLTTLPVLVPPEKLKPFRLRALNDTSTPLNTRVSSPTSFVDLIIRSCGRANAAAVRLYSGPTW